MPEAVRTCLWRAAGDRPGFAVLDGARDENLLAALQADGAPPWRCLFAGELDPDMALVAPYLVELDPHGAFTQRLLREGWGQHRGVFVASAQPLPALWRHLRAQTGVYGPDLEPLFFRFYDPRVLRHTLPTCDARQLLEFFGPVTCFVAEDEDPGLALAWSLADGRLVAQCIDGREPGRLGSGA